MTETTLIDIYEAAGGIVNEDRTAVTITGAQNPFEIVLRVIPTAIETSEEGEKITFAVDLHNEVVFGETGYLGTHFREIEYDVQITLPVPQVRIHKE